MITIVDYGMGNLRSVSKAFEKVGASVRISSKPSEVREAGRLVLPGVGAMADAMTKLRECDLIEAILGHIRAGRPFLGICLGLQMLFDISHEDGRHEGLGVFPGEVVRFTVPIGLKIPHMGWNTLNAMRPHPLLEGLGEAPSVYFVHSYHVSPTEVDVTLTTTDYGGPFVSMVARDNVVATQFHPEKSQQLGLRMLESFARWS